MQDYVAITVALRALGVTPDLFEAMVATMPWRDLPTEADRANVRRRFEALTQEEAVGHLRTLARPRLPPPAGRPRRSTSASTSDAAGVLAVLYGPAPSA